MCLVWGERARPGGPENVPGQGSVPGRGAAVLFCWLGAVEAPRCLPARCRVGACEESRGCPGRCRPPWSFAAKHLPDPDQGFDVFKKG